MILLATTFTSNYYPPIVDTYLPAFEVQRNEPQSALDDPTYTFTVRIYFSLSPYTDSYHSRYLHIKVVDQQTNQIALKYDSGLKLNGVTLIDPERESQNLEDKYYVELSSTEFKNFSPFKYYKVQLRTSATNTSVNASIGQLYKETATYSEWSTVCLIKGILKPKLNIKYFKNDADNIGTVFKTDTISVNGGMVFSDEEEDNIKYLEDIKTYSITFKDEANNIIDKSGDLYPPITNLRSISYDAKYIFEPKIFYSVTIDVLTTSYYSFSETFNFSVNESTTPTDFNGVIDRDLDNGIIKIHIEKSTENQYEKILYIKRTDSLSNFKKWEDIYSIIVPERQENDGAWILEWQDCSIESGVWYKYGIQSIDAFSQGVRTKTKILKSKSLMNLKNSLFSHSTEEYPPFPSFSLIINENNSNQTSLITNFDQYTEDQIMLILEDSFLVGKDGQQLKITYDGTVDSFKYNQYISKVDTIGSKYPFIRQNGNCCYRSFSLNGLITVLSDEDKLFIDDNDLFINENIKTLYQHYNENNDITEYRDYIKEREFREAVMNFLIADDVKLFRSTTEGNVLVKLMDISFTPKQELGRYLYSFSATAIECGECNIANYAKYKIQKRSITSYELISKIPAQIYKVEKEQAQKRAFTGISMELSYGDNLKTLLLNEEDIFSSEEYPSKFYIKTEENGETILTETTDEQSADIKEQYSLIDIQPYVMTLNMIDNPPNDIGWRFNVTTTDNVIQEYIITKENGYYTFSSDEPFTFSSLVFTDLEQGDTLRLNVFLDADLIYEKITYFKLIINESTGEYEWVEDDGSSSTPQSSTVFYTERTIIDYALTEQSPIDLTQDFLYLIKNKYKDSYIPTVINISNFTTYVVRGIDFPKGTIIQLIYSDDTSEKFIIQSTGSIDINIQDNIENRNIAIKQLYIIGQLLSNEISLTENFSLNSNNIILDNNQYKWREDGDLYDIIFYTDLSLNITTNNKNEANYGIIQNYSKNLANSKFRILAMVGKEE